MPDSSPTAKLTDGVTLEQAFWIMQRFLEAYWKRGGGHANSKPSVTTDVGGLLGDILFLPDGAPVDSAQLFDWLRAADLVIRDGAGPMTLQFERPK
jgi:hypothetical protein